MNDLASKMRVENVLRSEYHYRINLNVCVDNQLVTDKTTKETKNYLQLNSKET
jgi:hypothetical protein